MMGAVEIILEPIYKMVRYKPVSVNKMWWIPKVLSLNKNV